MGINLVSDKMMNITGNWRSGRSPTPVVSAVTGKGSGGAGASIPVGDFKKSQGKGERLTKPGPGGDPLARQGRHRPMYTFLPALGREPRLQLAANTDAASRRISPPLL